MDCKTARLLFEFHRPRVGELPADEAADLERHLAACSECDATGRAARRLDDCIGPTLRDVPVPSHLRQSVLSRLKDKRRAKVHRQLAWAARGFAVAAAAAVIGAVILWQVYLKPTTVNIAAVYQDEAEKYGSPSAEHVEAWFQEHERVPMNAPRQFDYAYLADYNLTTLQGKRVPKLVFQHVDTNGITRARVFVLKAEQFDLDALPDDPSLLANLDSGGQRVDIKKESPSTAYLIVYEGESLRPLTLHTEDQ